MNHIKNQTFLTNSTDPTNQKFVKEIWRHMFYDHGRREKWDLIWNYYRDRNRTSIEQIYRDNKNKGHKLRIIYRNDPVIHEIECPILPKKEKINKHKLLQESFKNSQPDIQLDNENSQSNNQLDNENNLDSELADAFDDKK